MPEPQPTQQRAPGVAARAAIACAALAAVALVGVIALRPAANVDLGYHLAYGEQFLNTGWPVDANPFIYTVGRYPNPADRPAPGPGCWYDHQGVYHFPNANWLSQCVMAAVNRLGGGAGLSMLTCLLALCTVAATVATMRRLDVPWAFQAAGIVVIAMVSYERFNLRPELMACLMLTIKLRVLCGPVVTWGSVAMLGLLQLLLANLHGYFPLGLMLTSAFAVDRAGRVAWQRLRHRLITPELKRAAALTGAALAVQFAVCFVNPWTWRLVALPVQTLSFLHHQAVLGGGELSAEHPWASIGEVHGTLAPEVRQVGLAATWWFVIWLALAGAGAVGAIARRRWAWALVICGSAAVGLAMRRNVIFAAFIGTPLALGAIAPALSWLRRQRWLDRSAWALWATVLLTAIGAWLTVSVVTQRFYFGERLPWRFGLGYSRLALPLGAAQWINDNKPAGRLWTDFESSSNLYYFTRPHRDVPILTNTWPYPPEVMAQALAYNSGRLPFEQARERWQLGVAAFAVSRSTAVADAATGKPAMLGELLADRNWRLVFVEGQFVIFVRAEGPNAPLAERFGLTEQTLRLDEYRRHMESLDPVPAQALYQAGWTFFQMDWDTAAIAMFRAAVEHETDYYQAWGMLGASLARRGTRLVDAGDPAGKDDWRQARESLERALHIAPDYEPARTNLRTLMNRMSG